MEQRRPSLFGPLMLITIGVLFLLANLNILPLTFWEIAARYWPLIFILIGLEIIVGRQSVIGGLVVVVLWVAIVGGVLWFSFTQAGASMGGSATEELVQPLGDIKSAAVDLNIGVAATNVTALEPGATDLMKGKFIHSPGVRIAQAYTVVGSEGRLILKEEGVQWMLGTAHTSRWELGLNPTIPLTLRINGGVGRAILDLSALNVPSLGIDAGVGSLAVTTPSGGVTLMRVNGGVGSLTIMIPQNVAARIRVDAGIGSIRVDQTRFPKTGDTYQSADYTTAPNKIEIEIDGGLGSITVQ